MPSDFLKDCVMNVMCSFLGKKIVFQNSCLPGCFIKFVQGKWIYKCTVTLLIL